SRSEDLPGLRMNESATTQTAAPAPAKGTRPEGAVTEADASKKVREMFTEIAPSYDTLNHLLSLQLDKLWRARTASILRPTPQRKGATSLRLFGAPGDLSPPLCKPPSASARIIGADFAHTMLTRAHEKSQPAPGHSAGPAPAISFFEADALRLPFRDA